MDWWQETRAGHFSTIVATPVEVIQKYNLVTKSWVQTRHGTHTKRDNSTRVLWTPINATCQQLPLKYPKGTPASGMAAAVPS